MNVQFESEAFPLSLKGETAACPSAPGAGSQPQLAAALAGTAGV